MFPLYHQHNNDDPNITFDHANHNGDDIIEDESVASLYPTMDEIEEAMNASIGGGGAAAAAADDDNVLLASFGDHHSTSNNHQMTTTTTTTTETMMTMTAMSDTRKRTNDNNNDKNPQQQQQQQGGGGRSNRAAAPDPPATLGVVQQHHHQQHHQEEEQQQSRTIAAARTTRRTKEEVLRELGYGDEFVKEDHVAILEPNDTSSTSSSRNRQQSGQQQQQQHQHQNQNQNQQHCLAQDDGGGGSGSGRPDVYTAGEAASVTEAYYHNNVNDEDDEGFQQQYHKKQQQLQRGEEFLVQEFKNQKKKQLEKQSSKSTDATASSPGPGAMSPGAYKVRRGGRQQRRAVVDVDDVVDNIDDDYDDYDDYVTLDPMASMSVLEGTHSTIVSPTPPPSDIMQSRRGQQQQSRAGNGMDVSTIIQARLVRDSESDSERDGSGGYDGNDMPDEDQLDVEKNNNNVSDRQQPPPPPMAVATRDSFMSHLKHNRPTQIIVLIVFLLMLGLAVALLLVLTNNDSNDSRGGSGQVPGISPPFPEDDTDVDIDDIYVQVGDSIDGAINSQFGMAVSMCRNGNRIAVGTPAQPGTSSTTGYVRTYDLDSNGNWIQVGTDIIIEATDNDDDRDTNDNSKMLMVRSDVSMTMSADCAVLAIGIPSDNNNTGRVDLYFLDNSISENNNNDWQPYGRSMMGENMYDSFGADVALSHDGLRIAVGAPGYDVVDDDGNNNNIMVDAGRVMVFILTSGRQGTWEPLGSPLDGKFEKQMSGVSVSLSDDGNTVGFGLSTMGDNTGTTAARVCDFVGGEWIDRIGDAGTSYGNYDTAWFVKLSGDGSMVAISNYYLNSNGVGNIEANDAIFVMASQYNHNDKVWTQLGSNIHWNSPGPKSGYIIALSKDGKRMGMGDPGKHTDDGAAAGHAHIYEYNNDIGVWCQLGPNKFGENGGDAFGYSISLSGDGTRIIMGAPYSRYSGPQPHGRVQVFDIHAENVIPDCSTS